MLRQFRRCANVVQMTMRQQDLHQCQAAVINFLFDFFRIAAGIDQCGQTGLFTPDNEQFWENAVTGIIR